MKTREAILLVSFGTSYQDAMQNSLDAIAEDLEKAAGILVYQAYTSGMIIAKLSKSGIHKDRVEEALDRAGADGIGRLYVISTHMIPGAEYHKMKKVLEANRGKFEDIRIAKPLLYEEEDCRRLVPVLAEIFEFQKECQYILMGHGSEEEANIRYQQTQEALSGAGFDNVHIASVEASPYLEDALEHMRRAEEQKRVVLHPLMIVAGDHARNDMAGEQDSFCSTLREKGFEPAPSIKGLGEYQPIRKLYVKKLMELIEG